MRYTNKRKGKGKAESDRLERIRQALEQQAARKKARELQQQATTHVKDNR